MQRNFLLSYSLLHLTVDFFFTQTVDILHILSFYISKYFILRYVYNIEHSYLQDILHKTKGIQAQGIITVFTKLLTICQKKMLFAKPVYMQMRVHMHMPL